MADVGITFYVWDSDEYSHVHRYFFPAIMNELRKLKSNMFGISKLFNLYYGSGSMANTISMIANPHKP